MTLTALQAHLEAAFYAPASTGFDATIRLTIGEEALIFRLAQGTLTFPSEPQLPDATFYFADTDIAWAVLSGQADPLNAFMEGRFRSDGYLLWTFALTAMFPAQTKVN